jgi:hypothetical protein
MKDSFYKELEGVFDKFPKYHMNILLEDFNAKVGREDIFKPTTWNENLHKISNDKGVRTVKFATSKNLSEVQCSEVVSFINLLGHLLMERLNQIHYNLIDRRRHSSTLDVWFFRAADCDTDPYLVMAKSERGW